MKEFKLTREEETLRYFERARAKREALKRQEELALAKTQARVQAQEEADRIKKEKLARQRAKDKLERSKLARERVEQQLKKQELKQQKVALKNEERAQKLALSLERTKQKELAKLSKPLDHSLGTVYVIGPVDWQQRETFQAKIGKGPINPYKRLKDMQVGNWIELTNIVISSVIINPLVMEAELHNMFDSVRIRGEWFSLTHIDIETIKNHLKTAK